MEGTAIFCLQDIECKWFQGYFVPTSTRHGSNHMGLLAVQSEDVDDCLNCVDGGYKEFKMTVYKYKEAENIEIDGITCTGGEMMRMRKQTDAGEYSEYKKYLRRNLPFWNSC